MAVRFQGNGSYVDFGNPSGLELPANHPFTFEAWIYFNTLLDYRGIFAKNRGQFDPYVFMLSHTAAGYLAAYNSTSWQASTNPNVLLKPKTPHHIAYSYNGSILTYYIDGVNAGSHPFTYPSVPSHNYKLGSWYAGYTPDGYLDNARFWKKALSEEEINKNKNLIIRGRREGLLASWLDVNGVMTDVSNNGFNGTNVSVSYERVDGFEFKEITDRLFVNIIPSNILENDNTGNVNFSFKVLGLNHDVENLTARADVFLNNEKIYETSDFLNIPTGTFNVTIPKSKVSKSNYVEVGNATEVATGYTTKSGHEISASSEYDKSNYQAWRAFDKVDNPYGWLTPSGTTKGWIQYDFKTPKLIKKIRIKSCQQAYVDTHFHTWTLNGYNNDTGEWDLIGDCPFDVFTGFQWKEYDLYSEKQYSIYRLNVTNTQGNQSYIGLNEMELIEYKKKSHEIRVDLKFNNPEVKDESYIFQINNYKKDDVRNCREFAYKNEFLYDNPSNFITQNNSASFINMKLDYAKTSGIITSSALTQINTKHFSVIKNCNIIGENLNNSIVDKKTERIMTKEKDFSNGAIYRNYFNVNNFTELRDITTNGKYKNFIFDNGKYYMYG